MKKSLTTTATLAATAALALAVQSPAKADVFLALQQDTANGGVRTDVDSGLTTAHFAGPYSPVFNVQDITISSLPDLADLLTFNLLGTAPAELKIFATVTNVTTALAGFLSNFESITHPAGWDIQMSTWIDPANGIYAMTDQIGSADFHAVGSDTDLSALTGTNPYSITVFLDIFSSGHSLLSSESAVSVKAIPEPSTLALLGGGLLLAGMLLAPRRTTNRIRI